jgi:superfamily II DNA or RNA helicase
MGQFNDLYQSFDPDPARRGKQFEIFVRWFLRNDPEWVTQVAEVWLWDDYPHRWGVDCGIDLVFRHANGETWAVQAKCYSPEHHITKHDVDKFLSESNRKGIDKRLLIATTDHLGANAKQVCDAQEKTVVRYLLSNFETAEIVYPKTFAELPKAKRKDPPKARPHQIEAISAVTEKFEEADRGQLIMACGTGKTFTTLWIKEALGAKQTLVLLPSLGLLSQTLKEWTYAANLPFKVLCVCSDETVGKKAEDEAISTVADLAFPVTSAIEEISNFLKGDGAKVVFSTYQSSPLVASAQKADTVPAFDLAIADEAHRCAGKADSAFSTVLDGTLIRATKRLFATATPRTYSTSVKKSAEGRGIEVVGMDDESVFGKVLHSLPFGAAISKGLLTDYRVVIIGVDDPTIKDWIERGELVETSTGTTADAATLASQIGLLKAVKDYDLKRIISFHSRVKRAESFKDEIQSTMQWVRDEHRPSGQLWSDYVSGAMPTDRRRQKLDRLKALKMNERGILTNARCLSEGVDVPSLDGVAFIDPRSSQVDIVQAVGRAIRLSPDKKAGTIVLPVFIEDGDSPEASIEASNFKPIWDVLNALKAHDNELSFELDQLRTELGRKSGTRIDPNAFSKIAIDLPLTVDTAFGDSLRTILVEKSTESWNFWYGLLQEYVHREGHASPPHNYLTKSGFQLGGWVTYLLDAPVMGDKPIDIIRSSAGRMEIGNSDDKSDITTTLSLGESLYVIKERGIYTVKLADQIDPARTNASIPPVQQRIVSLGSESPLVGQTLLTAKELFNEQVLPKWFDCTRAILLSLEALKDLAAVQEIKDSFVASENREVATLEMQPKDKGALVLPAIGAVDTQCKTFFQKADHAMRSLLDIVKMFYKKRYKISGIDDLRQHIVATYGSSDSFATYLEGIAPTLAFVRNTRNCLEHPHPPETYSTITDFALRRDGLIARPSIEVVSRAAHYPSTDISALMTDLALAIPQIFEGVVVGLCSKHIEPVGGLTPFVIGLDPVMRSRWGKHVQFGYGIKMGDSVAKFC